MTHGVRASRACSSGAAQIALRRRRGARGQPRRRGAPPSARGDVRAAAAPGREPRRGAKRAYSFFFLSALWGKQQSVAAQAGGLTARERSRSETAHKRAQSTRAARKRGACA
jgi:hypothetical protein